MKRDDTLLIVDAISAAGAMDLPMDDWGIDVLLSGSQKALMLPPGLAFGAASAKAWKARERSDLPKFYFDWKKERDSQVKNQTAFTPPVSLVAGLAEVLRYLKTEGKEKIFGRHEQLARAARAAMVAMGLKLYADRPVVSITTVVSPVDSDKLVKLLRDKYQVTLVGGQDAAKGKIFRIAHLGYFDDYDIIIAVSAIERALAEMGYPVEFGKGLGAAQAVFAGKA
jgi:aspartate aminotransferase-like enzyme